MDKIKDLQEQLEHKEQECEELKEQLKRKEENYQKLLSKSNKYIHNLVDENVQDISNLARQLEQLKRKEEELQAQRNFTTQEQRKIYCVAYDKTCETGNECKQKKCVFKDRLKYKQALDEIEKYLDTQQKYFDGEDYHNLLDIINKVKGSK